MGAFNAWLKVVIPLMVLVDKALPNVIAPWLSVYKLIASVFTLPNNEFIKFEAYEVILP